MKLIDRVFHLEEINGDDRCSTYLYRWTLLRLKSMAVYLHHFVGNDWTRDQHDHPKRFISIGLRGCYREVTPHGERIFCAPWIRSFPATHIHCLSMVDGGQCWTLVVTLRAVRPWGFWTKRGWVPWREYVNLPDADEQKDCL